jgi:hypothetical protein
VMQTELLALGIEYRHSRPLPPPGLREGRAVPPDAQAMVGSQAARARSGSCRAQIDQLCVYYNEVRPHRAVGRRPPKVAFEARDRARPAGPKIRIGAGVRVRRDRIDKGGRVTLRHGTRLHHIGVGWAHRASG